MTVIMRVIVIGLMVAVMRVDQASATMSLEKGDQKTAVMGNKITPFANSTSTTSVASTAQGRASIASKNKAIDDNSAIVASRETNNIAPVSMQDRIRLAYMSVKNKMVTHYKTAGLLLASASGLGYWWVKNKNKNNSDNNVSSSKAGIDTQAHAHVPRKSKTSADNSTSGVSNNGDSRTPKATNLVRKNNNTLRVHTNAPCGNNAETAHLSSGDGSTVTANIVELEIEDTGDDRNGVVHNNTSRLEDKDTAAPTPADGSMHGAEKRQSKPKIKAQRPVVSAETEIVQNQLLFDAYYNNDTAAMKKAIQEGAHPNLKLNPDEAMRMGVEVEDVVSDSSRYTPDTQLTILGGLLLKVCDCRKSIKNVCPDELKGTERQEYDATMSSMQEYKELMYLLINYGADIYGSFVDGEEIPLFCVTVFFKDTDLVQAFLEREQEIAPGQNSRLVALKMPGGDGHNNTMLTPLEIVFEGRGEQLQNMHAIVSLLLEAGATLPNDDVYGTQMAFKAALIGYQDSIATFLTQGGDVNVHDGQGCSLLIRAIQSGSKPLVEYLIQKGAAVDAIDTSHQTTLMHAAQGQCDEIVALLLQYELVQKQVCAQDHTEKNALEHLMMYSWQSPKRTSAVNIVQLLIPYGVEVHDEQLLVEACHNVPEAVSMVLKKQGNSEQAQRIYRQVQEKISSDAQEQRTYVPSAALSFLFDNEGEMGDLDQEFYNNLFSSFENCWSLKSDTISLVLEHDKKIAAGLPSFRNAVSPKTKRHAYIWLLTSDKVSVDDKVNIIALCPHLSNTVDEWSGETVLSDLVRGGGLARMPVDVRVIDALIKQGADVNSDTGYPALMYALESGSESLVNCLIENGAVVDAKNRFGTTVLMCAVRNKNDAIVALLMQHEAVKNQLHMKDINGLNALEHAIRWEVEPEKIQSAVKIVQLLTECGAQINYRGMIVDVCCSAPEVASVLLKHQTELYDTIKQAAIAGCSDTEKLLPFLSDIDQDQVKVIMQDREREVASVDDQYGQSDEATGGDGDVSLLVGRELALHHQQGAFDNHTDFEIEEDMVAV